MKKFRKYLEGIWTCLLIVLTIVAGLLLAPVVLAYMFALVAAIGICAVLFALAMWLWSKT